MDYSSSRINHNNEDDDDELPPTQPLMDDLPLSQTVNELHVSLYDKDGIPWILLDHSTVGRHHSNQVVLPNVPGISAKHGIFYIQIPASSQSSVRRRNQILNRICIYEDTSSVGTRIVRKEYTSNSTVKPKKDKVIMVHQGRIRVRDGDYLLFGEEKYRIMDPYEIERQIKLVRKKQNLQTKHNYGTCNDTENNGNDDDEDNDIDDTLDSYIGTETNKPMDNDVEEEEEEEDALPCTQAVNNDMVLDYTVEQNWDEFPLQSTNNNNNGDTSNDIPSGTNISIDEQLRSTRTENTITKNNSSDSSTTTTKQSSTVLSSSTDAAATLLSPIYPISHPSRPQNQPIDTLNDPDFEDIEHSNTPSHTYHPSRSPTTTNIVPDQPVPQHVPETHEELPNQSQTQLDNGIHVLHLQPPPKNTSVPSKSSLISNNKPLLQSTTSLSSQTTSVHRQNTIYDDEEDEDDTDALEDTPLPKSVTETKPRSQELSQTDLHRMNTTVTKRSLVQPAQQEPLLSPNFDILSLHHSSTDGITPAKHNESTVLSSSQKRLTSNLQFSSSSSPDEPVSTTARRTTSIVQENVSPDDEKEGADGAEEELPTPAPVDATDYTHHHNQTQQTSASQLPSSSLVHSNRDLLSASLDYAYDLPSQLMDMNDAVHPHHTDTHLPTYYGSTNRNKINKKLSTINDMISNYLSPSKLLPIQNIEPTQRYIPASAEDNNDEEEDENERNNNDEYGNNAYHVPNIRKETTYEGSPVLGGRALSSSHGGEDDDTENNRRTDVPTVHTIEEKHDEVSHRSPAHSDTLVRIEKNSVKSSTNYSNHVESRMDDDGGELESTGPQFDVQYSVMVSDSDEEEKETGEEENNDAKEEEEEEEEDMDQPPTEDWNESTHTSQVIGIPPVDDDYSEANESEEKQEEEVYEVPPSSTVLVSNSHILDHHSLPPPSIQQRASLSTDDISVTESQSMAALVAVQNALQLHNPPLIRRINSISVHSDVRTHAQSIRNNAATTNATVSSLQGNAVPLKKTTPENGKDRYRGDESDEADLSSEDIDNYKEEKMNIEKQVPKSVPLRTILKLSATKERSTATNEKEHSSPKRTRTSNTPATTTKAPVEPVPVRSSSRARVPRKLLGFEEEEESSAKIGNTNEPSVPETKTKEKKGSHDVIVTSSTKVSGSRKTYSTEEDPSKSSSQTVGKSKSAITKNDLVTSQIRSSPRKRKRDDYDEVMDDIPVPTITRSMRSTTATTTTTTTGKMLPKETVPKETMSVVPYATRRRSLTTEFSSAAKLTSKTTVSPVPIRKSTASSATKTVVPVTISSSSSSSSSSTAITGRTLIPKLCISRVNEDDEETLPTLAKALGAELVREVDKDTILVTQAIMVTLRHASAITIGKGIRTPAWIRESSRAGQWIDGNGYEPTETSGVLKDLLGPRFDVSKSMTRRTAYTNKPDVGIFTNIDIYVFPGTTTPENLQEIRELGKGNWLETLPNITLCKRLIKENKLWLIASNESHGPLLHKYYYDHSCALEKKKHPTTAEKGTLTMVPYHKAKLPIYDRGLLVVSLLLQTKPSNLDNYLFQYFDPSEEEEE